MLFVLFFVSMWVKIDNVEGWLRVLTAFPPEFWVFKADPDGKFGMFLMRQVGERIGSRKCMAFYLMARTHHHD